MLREPTVVHSEPPGGSTAHAVHAAMQFLMAVRYRKQVVFSTLLIAGLLAGLYYATATRYYGAAARVLMMGSGADGKTVSETVEGGRQTNLMLTFENLFGSAKVVEGALSQLTPEHRVDLAGAPETAWPAILQSNLRAAAIQGTNIIEVSYQSKDPEAAAAVVRAVVDSYRRFLDQTHRSTTAEVIDLLKREKTEAARQLEQKNLALLEARRRVKDIGLGSESKALHPIVQRAISFNEALIGAQKQRVELEATMAAIRVAVRNGEDLQQHIMTVANVVGKEILLAATGLHPGDSYALAQMERQLLEDKAALNTMREHFGPVHPEVVAKIEKIRLTEQYLQTYNQRVHQRLAKVQNTQLGPMLIQMVQQKLTETWEQEASLRAKFEAAEAQAIQLNGDLAQLKILEHEIQWQRSLHDVLLDRIANIQLRQDGQEIRMAVVQEPVVNASPVSPRLKRVGLLALLAGLGIGLCLVYVLDALDDRFRGLEDLQSQLNVPVLAVVRQLGSAEPGATGAESLQAYVAPNAAESEAFRTLRTALALADGQLRQIVISSAEPGDGKTTVLANLAVSYARSEKRTLLIDADLRRPGLTALMGMRGIEGLSTVIRATGDVVEIAKENIRFSGVERLDVLPSGPRPTNPAELLGNPRFSELLAWAETVYDQVLIDSPPTLATSDTAVIGRQVDGVVMVVQPDKNRRRLVTRAVESLLGLKIPLLGVVVNRVGSDNDSGYYGYSNGYGYGYGYTPDYGADEEDELDAVVEPQQEVVEIVPRRAA